MFEGYPKEIMTKDGAPLLIRPLGPQDEQRLNEFFSAVPVAERWFLREKLDDPEVLRKWLQELDPTRTIAMAAVNPEDGSIVASLRLYRRPAACMTHIAHLRIMVAAAYRQQRVGTWMLLDIIRLAMDLGIEKLVAEFVAGEEEPAIAAAAKLDFIRQAALKDYVKDPRGEYRDLIIMVKTVHRDWSDF